LTIALVNGALVLDLWVEVHEQIVGIIDVNRESSTNVLGAVDFCTLEFTVIKFLHCCFQVRTIFEFDEAGKRVALAAMFATEID
jgi:hypothetical protein